MNPWLLAARPKTLAAAVVPVLAGTSLAVNAGTPLHWTGFLCALGGAVFIQIGTNLVNDVADFLKGADTSERLGPVRVTQAGLLRGETVMGGAIVCFLIAGLCGIPLILRGGLPIIIIGFLSIVAAYAYTAGPYPLAYHGLGEIFVMIFFGLVATAGSYYVQRLWFDPIALLAGFACGAFAVVLLAINNLRDVASDRASGKRTLAARFGERFARGEIEWMLIAAYMAQLVVAYLRDWHLAVPLLTIPVAVLLATRVKQSEGRALNQCLALAGMLDWAFGITFLIGAVI